MNSSELEKYILELEQQKADTEPLCKSKKGKAPPDGTPPVAPPISPVKEVKVKKPRPPKTEKQIEAFKNVIAIRKANLDKGRLDKKIEASKILLANELNKKQVEQPKAEKPKKKQVVVESDSDSDSEDEIIVRPKKKRSKKIIIEDSSSSEDEAPLVKKDFGRSDQNKKSAVKIHDQPTPQASKQQPQQPKRNFFCE